MTGRKYRSYAGVGSRETPPDVLELMERIATRLAAKRYVLRTGHAEGADQAFERGAGHRAEVYLPWPGFESATPIKARTVVSSPCGEALDVAAAAHPAWDQLKPGARQLHARNAHEVLGLYLNLPVAFLVCWTMGALGGGGTGQAIRIAKGHGVQIFDLGHPEQRERVEALLA